MTYKEVVKVTFIPWEYQVLRKAYDFSFENLGDDMPEELYGLLEELQDVTKKLLAMSAVN